jgi:2-(1,2-epoxy-1,2-dihydrophenyl)acetyl-CoA isomerase
MGENIILFEESAGVGTLTLNRPDARNGVTQQLLEDLHAKVREISARADVRVLIVRGAGDDFCVGADIKAALAGTGTPPRYEDLAHAYHVSTLLHQMPQVTIAAIDGGCAGAGLGWAAACDLRYASDRAVFATAFLKVGASGDMGTAWFLNRIVGPTRARELMLVPEKVRAEEALRIGLVSKLYPAEDLHREVRAIAAQMAAAVPATLRLMKANLVSAETLALDQYIELETARHVHITSSPVLMEGFAAFMTARKAAQ